MRKYKKETKVVEVMEQLICNGCGKAIEIEQGITKENVLHVQQAWGYTSKKDGEVHVFDLCEDCYDHLIQGFQIPVEIKEKKEIL